MIARTRNVLFPAFIRRLDHWLLLRAPLLWRTRLFHLLVLLSLAVIATIPFIHTSIKNAQVFNDLNTTTLEWWWWRLSGSVVVLVLWVGSILRKPVGELAPNRHIVTVCAVAMGSYLWLVTPSLLAYPQINAIERFGPNNQVLREDYRFLSQHDTWQCVPPAVWKENISEFEQLRIVLTRYGYSEGGLNLNKGKVYSWSKCQREGYFPLDSWWSVYESTKAIDTILSARSDKSPFYDIIGIGLFLWLAAASLGIGILTAILSYPLYVWRRTFGTGYG